MIQYRKANVSDYEGITTLLLQEKLPVEDIDKGLPHFFVATANERIIGSIGLEVFGTVGLLRSMVVDHAFRGIGCLEYSGSFPDHEYRGTVFQKPGFSNNTP